MDKTLPTLPVVITDLNQASPHFGQTAATSTPMAGLQFADARRTRPVQDSFDSSPSQLSLPSHSSSSPETYVDPETRLEMGSGGD